MKLQYSLIALGLSFSLTVSADSNPYSFGGPCSSQGSWTQEALMSTSRIREVVKQIKDDPNCKAFSQSMQTALSEVDQAVQSAAGGQNEAHGANRLGQISKEISGLRSFLGSSGEMKNQVLGLMMNRTVENAVTTAQVASQTGSLPAQFMANSLTSVGSRVANSARNGMNLMNKVIDSIPQAQQCLENPTDVANYISGSIYVLGSFLGSGQDGTGSLLAQSVSKIANYAREMKFSDILKKLNEREYMRSMACLMEVTSETYCTARDAMMLFQQGQKEMLMSRPPQGMDFAVDSGTAKTDRKVADPFQGYYMLTQHLPNITNWMQKIQIGVDPKLPTDATFKNGVLEETINFYQMVNSLLGAYEKEKNSVLSQSNIEAQRNIALNMVISISETMGNTRFAADRKNFFLNKIQAIYIPFALIGIGADQVPQAITNTSGGYRVAPDDYLRQEAAKMPQFNDPKQLVMVIGENMKQMIADANSSLIEYYGQWFIVDEQALVNESVTSMTYTVRDSLKALDQYLAKLAVRIEASTGDQTSLGSIYDLRTRISKILKAYEDIGGAIKRVHALRGQGGSDALDDEMQKVIDKAYENLIITVYDQFNVMLARAGYLYNRMVTLVYQDYAIQLKQGINFSQHQEELMYATGKLAFDKIMALHAGNPANVKADLHMALNINKENLAAVELLFKDSLVAEIARLNMLSKGIVPTRANIRKDTRERLLEDTYVSNKLPEIYLMRDYKPEEASRPWSVFGMPISVSMIPLVGHKLLNSRSVDMEGWQEWRHRQRYPTPISIFTDESATTDTEFGSATYLKNQLCIQALAFNDYRAMWTVCNDAKLDSPFSEAVPAGKESSFAKYKDYLTMDYKTQLVKNSNNAALNHSERICAFRDFNRRNLVFYLTLGLKK